MFNFEILFEVRFFLKVMSVPLFDFWTKSMMLNGEFLIIISFYNVPMMISLLVGGRKKVQDEAQ